jgi:hypothetical protein
MTTPTSSNRQPDTPNQTQPPAAGPGDPADRLGAVHARLLSAVADLASGPGWQQMLRTAAALPSYSPHNILLITSQCPHARAVAGFHTWKTLGRTVRKGEKGLAILAPVLRPSRDHTGPAEGAPQPVEQPTPATPVHTDQAPERPAARRRLAGFRVVHVFDISQTDGPDLPAPPRPVLLDGHAPPGLLDGLTRQVHDHGFALVRHDFDIPHPGQTSPNGVTDYFARAVVIRPDLSAAQTTKTLAHELGHVLLHEPTRRPPALTREQAEVEAESVAYVVTAAHGLDSARYTIPYVTGWSGGDLDLVARTAERVLSTSRAILSDTPPAPTQALPEPTRERLRTPDRHRSATQAACPASSRSAHPAPALRAASAEQASARDQGRLW